jgi:hypothetical protein
MTADEERFAKAYVAYKQRVGADAEPLPEDFGVSKVRGERIAGFIHREFELDRLRAARALNDKLNKPYEPRNP